MCFMVQWLCGHYALDRLNLPSVLVLNGCGISHAGHEGEIAAFCAHVVELDLSHNKLQDWHEVSSSVMSEHRHQCPFILLFFHIFVLSRLDYCNSLYAGIPQSSFTMLQMVQNAAARFVTGICKCEHISRILMALIWLPMRYRVDFKNVLSVFKSLNGLLPSYLSDLLKLNNSDRCLRSTNNCTLSQP